MRCGKIFVVARDDYGFPNQHGILEIVNRPQFVKGGFSACDNDSDEGVNISEIF